jgi:hypothetical protein
MEMKKKQIIVGISLIFFAFLLIPDVISTNPELNAIQSQKNPSTIEEDPGTLSGYVTDTAMNPIPGALVRVYFHETYRENYTDATGYYHVIDIPICYCMKNATCSKDGYYPKWVLLAITENTTYDFILTAVPSTFSCWGNLTWSDVQPGEIVTGKIWVMNIGESDLDWEITSWPSWGIWDFGSYFPILPPGGTWIVTVNVTAPTQENETFTGEVILTDKNNISDSCSIDTSLTTKNLEGYDVSERIIGFIRNLQIEDNSTSFQIIVGGGIRIIEYDDGEITAFAIPYLFRLIHWSGDFLFEGILQPHFIKGIVSYRVN